jgi:RHS repeat-associated protein
MRVPFFLRAASSCLPRVSTSQCQPSYNHGWRRFRRLGWLALLTLAGSQALAQVDVTTHCYQWQWYGGPGTGPWEDSVEKAEQDALQFYTADADSIHGGFCELAGCTTTLSSRATVDPIQHFPYYTFFNILVCDPTYGCTNPGVALPWRLRPDGCQFKVLRPPVTECKCNLVGHPINPADGSVYAKENDIPSSSGPLEFTRYYNSTNSIAEPPPPPADLGPAWRHSYSQRITPVYQALVAHDFVPTDSGSSIYTDPSAACASGFAEIRSQVSTWTTATASYSNGICTVSSGGSAIGTIIVYSASQLDPQPDTTQKWFDAVREDGEVIRFLNSGGTLAAPPSVSLQLQQTGTGFNLTDENDNLESYNASGELLSITTRAGVVQSLTYDGSNRLSTVVDSFGHQMTLGYDPNSRLISVTNPGSNVIHYGFDGTNRLTTVTNPDSTTRSYQYGNTSFPDAVTAEIDENSAQYSTWSYDTQGRATSTSEAGGANAVTLVYSSLESVTVTDALGANRTFTYGRYGDSEQVAGISGSQCSTCTEPLASTYDTAGFLSSRTDYNGNVTHYVYDDVRGLETSRTEAYGTASARTITTQWNSSFRVPTLISVYSGGSATGTPLRKTSFTYDGTGNTLTKTLTDTTVSPNVSRTWTYTYDGYGRILTETGPRTDLSSVTTYTHYTCTSGAQCGHLHTATDAAGNVTTYLTYDGNGKPLTISDANGVVTTLAYDSRQRLTSRTASSEATAFTYWPTGLLKKVTLPDSSYLQYTYDNAHRLTQIADSAGNRISYTLDALGNRTAENSYDPSNALHRTHSRVFNSLSELYQDINAAGTSAVTTTFAYDSNGNQTSVAAPLSRTTGNAYDPLNRLKQITDPGSGVTQFGYDASDGLTSVTDPRSLTTSYAYNGFGDLASQVSPDTGTTTSTYDSGGNLATSTDARGAVSTYGYDASNRVGSVAFSLGGVTDQTLSFTYDAGTNGKGHLTGASDANHAMSWTYDSLGRVLGKTQTADAVALSVGYAYTNGNLTTLTTPSNRTVAFAYNSNHQITSVSVNGTVIASSITYEPLGAVNGWTWGNATATSRTYDADGNVSQITSSASKSYSYDNASRMIGISDSGNSALSWTYGYDLLDRTTSASRSGQSQSFTYDANGNRLTQGGTTSSTFSIDSGSNRLSSATGALSRTYGYDGGGHTTGYGGLSFTYNAAGRMSSVTGSAGTTTYVYNALGQRIRKVTPSSKAYFAYDEAGHLIGEYDGMGSLIQEIVWLGNTPIASVRLEACGFSIFYIHTDHLNTPRRITRRSTTDVVWSWESDPFGASVPNEDPSGLGAFSFNLRFPGQYFDAEAGLAYNMARDYDPAVGRYTESDPLGLKAGVNTYAYVGSRPTLLSDPNGLMGFGGGGSAGAASHGILRSMGPPPATYYGGEFYFLAGGGLTSVTCKNECGAPQTFRYVKVCPLGAAVGGSGGAGLVTGMTGKACDPSNYAGWFFETGGSLGPLSIGADFGYNSDGSLSGVNEGSAGFGFGAKFKAIWCYYIPIG